MPNLWLIFGTGLLAGGVTCMAVQGGLLTATVAARIKDGEKEEVSLGIKDVGIFLTAKFLAHVVLGGLMGLLGSTVIVNPGTAGMFQGLVGVYLLGVSGAMLEVHPFFRRFLFQTPKPLRRFIRETSKSGKMFAPAVLGAATIFIPCGTTLAMMTLAVSSGNPWWGAAILGTFVLGTSPLFMLLGVTLSKLGDVAKQKFFKMAGIVVLVMGLTSINSALVLNGSQWTIQNVTREIQCAISFCRSDLSDQLPAEEVTITFGSSGYKTDKKVVKAGSKVKLNLVNKGGYGCVQAFTLPKLGISKVVPPGTSESIEITVPEGEGELDFSCSMGMYTGQLAIVK